MTLATAPGKIILFGEHAVVYGQPALAVPVIQVHAKAEVSDSDRPGIWFRAPGIHLDETERAALDPRHPLRVAAELALSALPPPETPRKKGFRVLISSSIPIASGLGSGAAVTVALVCALTAHVGLPLPDEKVNDIAYEVEKIHHGTPSGIDNTVIVYQQPVFFIKGQLPQRFSIARPFTLVIGDTGIPAPTKEAVADVRRLREENPRETGMRFAAIGDIARNARLALENGDLDSLGALMNENHAHLQALTVSSPELDALVEAARAAGARGAKLSGGGRGGNMIALADDASAESIAEALRTAGAARVFITRVA